MITPTQDQAITKFFDHIRFDFNVRGIIIYNGNASCQRVEIAGYPYVRNAAVNDNERMK